MDNRKLTGSHYTPKLLSDFVAKQILHYWNKPTQHLRLLDPAVGDGELLLSLVEQLYAAQKRDLIVDGFDINKKALEQTKNRIFTQYPEISINVKEEDFINIVLSYLDNSLFANTNEYYDIVIANPPYVRTQNLEDGKAQELSAIFNLTGRVDLYFAFLLGISHLLKEGGIVGIIVSNRFMTTKAGACIREGLKDLFEILHVFDLGDTKLFEAAVLPAVLILRKNSKSVKQLETNFTSVYTSKNLLENRPVNTIIDALSDTGHYQLPNDDVFEVRQGILEYGKDPSSVWRISNKHSDAWLECVRKNTWKVIRELVKVRVGVKTTADSIFIRDDWHTFKEDDIPECLSSLLTHDIARQYKAFDIDEHKKILYPYRNVNGKRKVLSFDEAPRAGKYLQKHHEALNKRKYVVDSGREWYEIWVPHHPVLWEKSKIVFPDISTSPTFWLDKSKSIVNGDCYWMVLEKTDDEDLLWLLMGVCNSEFIEKFYDHKFHNKLYAGRRRFITQYVQEFPIPDPKLNISKEIVTLTKSIYDSIPNIDVSSMQQKINSLVYEAFGLSVE